MSLLGAPIGPDIPDKPAAAHFDHVPALHELLPNGGWPGVVYAQACVHNLANAAARVDEPAHMRPIRGTEYYEVSGPKGVVQMALVGCGSPIPGAAPECGARLFFTDGELEKASGHPVSEDAVIWFRPQPAAKEEPDGSKQSKARKGQEAPATQA